MVAETALVAVAIEGTERLDTAVPFVFFHKEGGIVDEDLPDAVAQQRADEHMVDALLAAVVAVGAGSTMQASGSGGNIVQAVVLQV